MIIRCIEQFGEDMKECPVFIDIRYADKKRLRSRLEHDQITNLEALDGTFYIFIKDYTLHGFQTLREACERFGGHKTMVLTGDIYGYYLIDIS